MPPHDYRCGYCGKEVGSAHGFLAKVAGSRVRDSIYVCPRCQQPMYFDSDDFQVLGVPYGDDVEAVPDDIASLYAEARRACSTSAYTAAVLTCRKILMNIAVAQGAEEGLSFMAYVEYLSAQGYVPPGGEGWVDHIRRKGNDANHEIQLMRRADAEELISFTEMLLKFIYEFPSRVPTVANEDIPRPSETRGRPKRTSARTPHLTPRWSS